MDVKLAALADFASMTREGKLNILGIFDQLSPVEIPASLPIFYLVVVLEASPSEAGQEKSMATVLTDQDGNIKARLETTIKVDPPAIPGVRRKYNQISGIAGLKFDKEGTYQFAILINGEEKAAVPLRVLRAREVRDVSSN